MIPTSVDALLEAGDPSASMMIQSLCELSASSSSSTRLLDSKGKSSEFSLFCSGFEYDKGERTGNMRLLYLKENIDILQHCLRVSCWRRTSLSIKWKWYRGWRWAFAQEKGKRRNSIQLEKKSRDEQIQYVKHGQYGILLAVYFYLLSSLSFLPSSLSLCVSFRTKKYRCPRFEFSCGRKHASRPGEKIRYHTMMIASKFTRKKLWEQKWWFYWIETTRLWIWQRKRETEISAPSYKRRSHSRVGGIQASRNEQPSSERGRRLSFTSMWVKTSITDLTCTSDSIFARN